MMLYEKPTTSTVEEMLDKYAIRELFMFERFCRDNALWSEMYKCFADDSIVTISWYQGSGRGFVDASMKMASKAPHKMHNSLIWLNKNRTHATAITMGAIQMRKNIEGVAMDLTSYSRFVTTFVKNEKGWLIQTFDAIYEKDSLVPATPAGLSNEGLQKDARDSYCNLTRVLGSDGYPIATDLPGDDMPETTVALIDRAKSWIAD